MEHSKQAQRDLWQFLTRPDERQREILKESSAFLIFLTIVLSALYVVIISQKPALRTPTSFSIITGLFILHIFLHWFSGWCAVDARWRVLYLLLQAGLASAIVQYSGEPQFGIGLFSALLGETIGILGTSMTSRLAIIMFVVLQPLNYYLLGGMEVVREWLPLTIGLSIILIVMMTLIQKSLEAGEKAQQLLRELESAHRRLADYAAQVETLTLKEERTRMARDLHDTLAQGLAGLTMELEAAQYYLDEGNSERVSAILGQAMDRARSTLSEARQAIGDLREQADVDLARMVHTRARHFSEVTGRPCDVKIDFAAPVSLNNEVRQQIEHILGESLANAAVHANANRIAIRVVEDRSGGLLEVLDDGIGFDPALATRKAGHFGLIGMQERARLVGGHLQIDSAPGQGCRITFQFPVIEEAA